MLAAGMTAMLGWGSAIGTADAAGLPFHVERPPPGHTGGFGEPTCRACHVDSDLNAPGSTLGILGLEGPFAPGETRRVTVRLESFDMVAAGFQGAFRFAAGPRRGETAGVVAGVDGRTGAVPDSMGRILYIQHTAAGTPASADVATWTFEWTAPASPGEVVLHVAANSANGDDSPLGDLIYTAETPVRVGR